MCDTYHGQKHSINYACNAVALFEHQWFQYAQLIELKYTGVCAGHVIAFYRGEPARYAGL